ncbi:MAG TPA: cupredoxin domain-containing protein [Anaerolineales bacterium]|nr:cupredoxin domain-containing protein [Anaerolineales bacterium]
MLKKAIILVISLNLLSACAAQPSQPANELTVEMTDFAYNPSALTIPAGQPVTLMVDNTGNIEHDFVVEKIDVTTEVIQDNSSNAHHAHGEEENYDLHVSARPGEASILQLTVTEPGTYKVFCSVEGHEEAGMIGELIVVDQD